MSLVSGKWFQLFKSGELSGYNFWGASETPEFAYDGSIAIENKLLSLCYV